MSVSFEVKSRKRGRGSWAHGKAREFLLAHRDQFSASEGSKAERGIFYDRITNLWYQNFGPDQPYNEAPPDNIELSYVLKPGVVRPRGSGEYTTNWLAMRDRLGAWMRNNFAYGAEGRQTTSAATSVAPDGATSVAPDGATSVEQESSSDKWVGGLLDFYKQHHFERIKDTYKRKWSQALADFDDSMASSGAPQLPKPSNFHAMNAAVPECFDNEPAEFKEEVTKAHAVAVATKEKRKEVEKEIAQGLRRKVRREKARAKEKARARAKELEIIERTPEEYQKEIDGISNELQFTLDKIYAKAGLCATITLAGPWPSKNGQIQYLTLQNSNANGGVGHRWDEVDQAGWKAAVTSFVATISPLYSPELRNRRALKSSVASQLKPEQIWATQTDSHIREPGPSTAQSDVVKALSTPLLELDITRSITSTWRHTQRDRSTPSQKLDASSSSLSSDLSSSHTLNPPPAFDSISSQSIASPAVATETEPISMLATFTKPSSSVTSNCSMLQTVHGDPADLGVSDSPPDLSLSESGTTDTPSSTASYPSQLTASPIIATPNDPASILANSFTVPSSSATQDLPPIQAIYSNSMAVASDPFSDKSIVDSFLSAPGMLEPASNLFGGGFVWPGLVANMGLDTYLFDGDVPLVGVGSPESRLDQFPHTSSDFNELMDASGFSLGMQTRATNNFYIPDVLNPRSESSELNSHAYPSTPIEGDDARKDEENGDVDEEDDKDGDGEREEEEKEEVEVSESVAYGRKRKSCDTISTYPAFEKRPCHRC